MVSEEEPWIEVMGWDDFQHYRDRDPVWIKLHRTVLDNIGWARLQDASKSHLVGLWLLAARHANHIPADVDWIAGRISATERVDLQPLVAQGFIKLHGTTERVASTPLAKRYPSRARERRGEEKREEEIRDKRAASDDAVFELAWAAYPRRPNNPKAKARRAWDARIVEGVAGEAMLAGVTAYAAHCAREQTPPRFVKLAATFFGPDKHWETDYGPATTGDIVVYDERGELTPEAARAVGLLR